MSLQLQSSQGIDFATTYLREMSRILPAVRVYEADHQVAGPIKLRRVVAICETLARRRQVTVAYQLNSTLSSSRIRVHRRASHCARVQKMTYIVVRELSENWWYSIGFPVEY